MKNIILGGATLALLVLLSMNIMKPSIQGRWIAEHVVDNQKDTLNIDTGVIQLDIIDDRYTFLSTLKQRESGTIKRSGNQLIVQNEGAQPYKMDISSLTKSHLTLVMEVQNTPRTMVMRRLD